MNIPPTELPNYMYIEEVSEGFLGVLVTSRFKNILKREPKVISTKSNLKTIWYDFSHQICHNTRNQKETVDKKLALLLGKKINGEFHCQR